MELILRKEIMPPFLVESGGYEGVRRIAGKVAEDIRKVTGALPEVVRETDIPGDAPQIILCATLGKSRILDALAESGLADLDGLRRDGGEAKREVYRIQMISLESGEKCPFFPESLKKILLICGSDKRGTIYGMFSLSEYIGVSPLCYWGDVEPAEREEVVLRGDIETLSREPSVKYRGFFINDEWPCFGTWVTEHFGGFNAEAYDHVFELLLRLKGNYLWPAMWSASFPLDGPGSRNEELADLYGVVMGYSHHEPCLRASEEWDKVRGENSPYGNEWNFYTNEKGLLCYWEDALKRSGKYENIITIGMRGERDTSMLGKDSTLRENIELLKDIIRKQRALIERHVKRESGQVPLLLALYKEVEPYFYGDEDTPGLKDWEGLEGVTCMLCEDNYGYMRTLPGEEIRHREGGFGMYYHLDYHGGPVSYEWVDSTPLSQIWEQMSEAYEYGVRDVWIVNVGDLKFHEIPLSYFMALAYNYEKWGYGNPESPVEYTREWVRGTFPGEPEELFRKIGKTLTDYIRLNSLRRPESLHTGIYHPCHEEETDRMLERIREVEELSEAVMGQLWDNRAYYSMIHYPTKASMNLLKLYLYAGKNHHYAAQNRKEANRYGMLARECIRADREFVREWASFRDGKWNGMQLAKHIGFTRWCQEDYRYPLIMYVEPAEEPRLSVSRKDREETVTGGSSPDQVLRIPDFGYAGGCRVVLEIANEGQGTLRYRITAEGRSGEGTFPAGFPEWLRVSPAEGNVESLQEVELLCRREALPEEPQELTLWIEGGGARVKAKIYAGKVGAEGQTQSQAEIGQAEEGQAKTASAHMTFFGKGGITVIAAEHFYDKKDTKKGQFRILEDYGKHGSAVKVFPSTAFFAEQEEKPELCYRFLAEEAGEYWVELMTAPANSPVYGQGVHFLISGGKGEAVKAQLISPDFAAGDCGDSRWAGPALDKERKTKVRMYFEKGVQELRIAAMEAGTALERIRIYRTDIVPPESYLGPEESCCTGI